MILANIRARLGREDAQLAVRLVSRGSERSAADAEALLADQGLDPLLDDPQLLEGLLDARQGAHASLPLFSYVVVRHALRETGEEERRQRVAPLDLAPVDLRRNQVVDQVVGERREAVGAVVVREDAPMTQEIAVQEVVRIVEIVEIVIVGGLGGGVVGGGRGVTPLATRRMKPRGPVGACRGRSHRLP